MRTREEIEQSYTEVVVPTGSETVYKLLFELLLDIREMLSSQHEDSMVDKIAKAREEIEDNRRKDIEERIRVM